MRQLSCDSRCSKPAARPLDSKVSRLDGPRARELESSKVRGLGRLDGSKVRASESERRRIVEINSPPAMKAKQSAGRLAPLRLSVGVALSRLESKVATNSERQSR